MHKWMMVLIGAVLCGAAWAEMVKGRIAVVSQQAGTIQVEVLLGGQPERFQTRLRCPRTGGGCSAGRNGRGILRLNVQVSLRGRRG